MATVTGLLVLKGFTGHAATGTIQDVQHVVILMQENRSFDHYCGMMGGVRGYSDRNPLLFGNGQPDFYQPQGNGTYVLPFPSPGPCIYSTAHSVSSGEQAWDNGKWDQWIPAKDTETMVYFTPDNLVLHQALANSYTICDNYFCSLIGPTDQNRLYLFTGMIDPNGTGGGPATEYGFPPGGYTWTTYPERLQAAGVSWRVYRPNGDWFGDALAWFAPYINAAPGNPLYDRGVATVPDAVAALQADVTNGTLPQVSWIIPTLDQSGHPPDSPQSDENFIKQILDALALDPSVLNSTVFILTYDENDGLFDHIPSPIAPPGTPDEFVNGQPLGLGGRVPMFLVSPWSRGGHVCSQVFDHTSIIRFLETWTGVQEPNISAWRRQVCGDLTAAFDFTHPNTSNYPVLPNVAAISVPAIQPSPPVVQAMPVQQTNALLSVPLPYQPEITAQTDCAGQQILLNFTNGGTASVHFAIYANPVQSSGPQQCDIAAGSSLTVSLPVAGTYDFLCYGPNGFQRRFAGALAGDCKQIEVNSMIDTNAGVIVLAEQNSTGVPVTYIVTDGYGLVGPWTNTVAAGSVGNNSFNAVAANNGWYDLTVTTSSDPNFLRHYTGHIETGAWMLSESTSVVIAPQPPVTNSGPTTPTTTPTAPIVLTNAPGVLSLMASIPTVPNPKSLALYSASFSTNMVLVYPGWASNCTVLASASMAPGTWAPVSVSLTNLGNYAVAVLPSSTNAMFFCLRQ